MKIGVDTNVLFYAVNRDNQFHEEAKKHLALLVKEEQVITTQQNLVELSAVLTKRGLSYQETEQVVRSYIRALEVITPTDNTITLFTKEIKTGRFKGVRLFDLYLAMTFLSNRIDLVYTYDKDFSRISNIRVWRPQWEKS